MTTKIFAGAAAFAALSLAATLSQAAEYNIRVGNWNPNSNHAVVNALNAWAEMIETESDGRIEVSVDKAIIGKPAGQYDLIRQGVVQAGWGALAWTPGRFDLSQVIELPFLSASSEEGSRKITEIWQENFADKEFTDTKLLALHVHAPGALHTKVKVASLDDLKGQKIRTLGSGVEWAEALGATAVVMPASKAHEALARGVADGILFPFDAIQSYRLEEILPYHLEVPNGLYTITFFFALNKEFYNSLPDDLKAVIDANSGPDLAAEIGRHWDQAAEVTYTALSEDPGHEVSLASPEMMAELESRASTVFDAWKEIATEKGVDADGILAKLAATGSGQ